jgi:hypothetical protein
MQLQTETDYVSSLQELYAREVASEEAIPFRLERLADGPLRRWMETYLDFVEVKMNLLEQVLIEEDASPLDAPAFDTMALTRPPFSFTPIEEITKDLAGTLKAWRHGEQLARRLGHTSVAAQFKEIIRNQMAQNHQFRLLSRPILTKARQRNRSSSVLGSALRMLF